MTLSNKCTLSVYGIYQRVNVCIWQSTDLPHASLFHQVIKSYWQAWQNWSWKRDEKWVRVWLFCWKITQDYSSCMSESDGFDDSLAKKKRMWKHKKSPAMYIDIKYSNTWEENCFFWLDKNPCYFCVVPGVYRANTNGQI